SLTGQLIKMTDACGNQIEYQYDERDQLLSVCQYGEFADKDNSLHENCQITRYERNPMGQITKVTDAMGNSETFGYDKRGQLIEKIDKEGYITKYGYNVNGDINHIQYSDGREVKLSYNPLRQLQEIEDWVGITRIETDVRGRITKVTNPKGESVSYSYMADGQRESIIYPDDTKVEYKYDEYGRLASMVQDGKTFTYGYDLLGQICQKTYPNGIKTTYDYTSKGEILNLIHSDEKGILEQYTYSYDVLGNKTSIEKKRRGLEGESGIYEYKYDEVGRLASIVKDGVNLRSYTYDAFGNRTSLKEKNNKTNYLYNALNQLVVKADMQGETTYKYDRRGNLSSVWKDGIVRNQYEYGAINRLEQAVNSNGESARYVYNGLGYRVGKEVENDLTPVRRIEYVLDLTRGYNNLLQKREDAAVQKYLWDGSITALFDEECSEEMYYLVDELGSPMRLFDFEGNIINTFGYDEFGQDIYANQMDRQPFGYTGYQTDSVAGLYFAQAREYDSSTGRFGAVDPYRGELDNGDTLNSYIYCLNNPLLYFDPWGLAPAWLEGIWVHIQIENELKEKRYGCDNAVSNVVIRGAGLGNTGIGIADLVVFKTGYVEIYEIKPATWSTGGLNVSANNQLNRYVKNFMPNYDVQANRGKDVFEYTVTYDKDPTRTLTYWTNGDGLIYYSLSPKLEPEKEQILEKNVLPERKSVSEGKYITEELEERNINSLAYTLAFLYTVANVFENTVTYGAGTADDFLVPLIWQWAISI
ncbi:MAG: RHS repeat domain-containing protein, partial [Lachnospira sp.]